MCKIVTIFNNIIENMNKSHEAKMAMQQYLGGKIMLYAYQENFTLKEIFKQ